MLAVFSYVKRGYFVQFAYIKITLNLLVTAVLFCPCAALALCVIETPINQVSARTTLVNSGNTQVSLRNASMLTNVYFKCDVDTNYHLTVSPNDGTIMNGTLVLFGSGSAQILIYPKIKTINGNVVNRYFSDMVGGAYVGKAIAGETNRIQIEFEPVKVRLEGNAIRGSGHFNGRAQFSLLY